MNSETVIIQIIIALVQQTGLNIIVALLLSRLGMFTRIIRNRNHELKDVLFPILVLGILGTLGTYTGIPIQGALANARMVPVFVGGLLGGPVVGIFAGLIAGIHRWGIDVGGFTAVSCMVSTIAEGALAGFLSPYFYRSSRKPLFALWTAAIAEVMQMILILITARPFPDAVNLVKVISMPMIIANAIGCSLIILVFENLFSEGERMAARQSHQVLKIADQTLALFRRGLNPETATAAAEIIRKEMSLIAVSFTDRDRILVHSGAGDDHHNSSQSMLTRITKEAMRSGLLMTAGTADEIGCFHPECALKSAVIAPLLRDDECIGTLKLYKGQENAINQADIETARGLATLISSQLELSRLEEQKKLLRQAQMLALQAQINPHFLFNAINTIVSLIRTDPEKGRELLVHLGTFYRNNLQAGDTSVSLETEIKHIKAYLEIEKARFGDRLNVVYDIQPGLKLDLPPLLLQPLVENAVIHGIQPFPDGGTVTIRAMDAEGGTFLMVHDNGQGFKCDEFCDDPEDAKCKSIGIDNIRQRLLNLYGPSSTLHLICKQGEGTTASIFIPSGVSS
ncbi:sensor histidine kinase [Oceanispirochaeta crateris]|uniref:histidine kinase n=1 Tax=Oceanispirochaeta crateris TaxID=2518645 RepID=A0A5C1QNZ6_9SPIO|nr:LytS/YhcK type 5TM receptor domain-containing protein [Oceanispirochaeta crateris]QEN08710.1 sensor histidine kinase [Oceanispirochaeta crateris]